MFLFRRLFSIAVILTPDSTLLSTGSVVVVVIIIIIISYETTVVAGNVVKPISSKMKFRTERKVPKVSLAALPFNSLVLELVERRP